MASRQEKLYTPEEYLALERESETKHEYLAGRIYAMSRGTTSHARIIGNVHGLLHAQLRGRPCETFTDALMVRVDETGLHTYPDVSALCGEARLAAEEPGVLLNPSVLVEVLSKSTEGYDRGEKFAHYQRIPTLREYVLVAQDRMRVERFTRTDDGGSWLLTRFEGSDAVVELPSIGCVLRVGDLYERVELPPARPLRAVYEDAREYATAR
jgi:Uma2 family endonuclease